jgi:excisionase family DNA binding protein
MSKPAPTYITVHALARRLGLPVAWLRAEARAGRLPSLRTGRRLMFDAVAVEQALAERAQGPVKGGGQ